MAGKNTRMQQWLQYRVRVTIKDGRRFVGTLIAFDKHFNLVLADCEEFRMTRANADKSKVEVKRTLGFIMLRGENIVSFTAEAAPAVPMIPFGVGGPGKAAPAGRGAPIIMPGGQVGMPHIPPNAMALQAPIRGLVGAAPMQHAPQQVGAPAVSMPPRPN